jgi:hypothetical protein
MGREGEAISNVFGATKQIAGWSKSERNRNLRPQIIIYQSDAQRTTRKMLEISSYGLSCSPNICFSLLRGCSRVASLDEKINQNSQLRQVKLNSNLTKTEKKQSKKGKEKSSVFDNKWFYLFLNT